jgi:prepilin-type N-terminal cleavage/methylation domain-containing protein
MRRLAVKRRSGFTLVEVLVALGILLFGLTAVLGLLTFGSALSRSAQLRTVGASAAEAVIADLEESLFPLQDGEAGEPRSIDDRSVPGFPTLMYSAKARAHPERAREYRVDIQMRWQSGGVERERSFTTVLLREVPFSERLRRQIIEGERPEPARKQ